MTARIETLPRASAAASFPRSPLFARTQQARTLFVGNTEANAFNCKSISSIPECSNSSTACCASSSERCACHRLRGLKKKMS